MTLSILLSSNENEFTDELLVAFEQLYPEVDVYLPGQEGAENASLAACWFPEESLLQDYPQLKCIHSLAAGVDHLGAKIIASGLPVCRIVDENQQRGMFEFVLWGVLNMQRDFDRAVANQKTQTWKRYPQKAAEDIRIGVMGLGSFGEYVAKQLADFGYQVFGWSRSPKQIDGVTCLSGDKPFGQSSDVLGELDVIVNLLPLNSATQGILNTSLFAALPKGAYVINCGRGGHVDDADLIAAVKNQHLRGALLDVFNEEPLPASPFWTTEGIIVTPHMASAASTNAIVKQIVTNAQRLAQGEALINGIDASKGY